MKTPREVLLESHHAAGPKLDQIRHATVADLRECPAAKEEILPVQIALKLWRELIWPCRRTWAGLTAVWLALAVFNLTHADRHQIIMAKSTVPPGELRLAFREQQQLLNELIGPPAPEPAADLPRRPDTQPRSQRQTVSLA